MKEKEKADDLSQILRQRLAKHICTKIDDQKKHNHPALLFVCAKLDCFAALLYYYRQARFSPVMNLNSCLLAHPSSSGFLPVLDQILEGSYLYYSIEDLNWIQSGKVIGSDRSNPVNGVVLRNEKGHSMKAVSASLVDGECFC